MYLVVSHQCKTIWGRCVGGGAFLEHSPSPYTFIKDRCIKSTSIHDTVFSLSPSASHFSRPSFLSLSFFSSCQSYHFALGFHFSGALMGAVMESWLTGRADFHTLIMTSPLSRFHFTSNHIKTGWLEGEKHQTTPPPPRFHWGNNVQCWECLQQKWSLSSKRC